jgi:putative ATPase
MIHWQKDVGSRIMKRPNKTLFEHSREHLNPNRKPLPARIRPQTVDDIVGQDHLMGKERFLRQAIETDHVPSMILWGPPGSGKTSMAQIIANTTKAVFASLSAVESGVADLRRVVADARGILNIDSHATILFVDEVHHFNKTQQDVLLPHVENGTIIFIGATTENPSFEVNAPLLSRCRIFRLNPLNDDAVREIINRALLDPGNGLEPSTITIAPRAMDLLVTISSGDARVALNAVELAVRLDFGIGRDSLTVTEKSIRDVLQTRRPLYDKGGAYHYDSISAYIKSMRASDPDGAIYWLARMLEGGEDPGFIARRNIIFAAEDIGLASPNALQIAVSAQNALHIVGMPEASIPLAEVAVFLATCPKSNTSYVALNRALKEVREGHEYSVPLHLRNAPNDIMKDHGHGLGYLYPHDFPGAFAGQRTLPDEIKEKRFYDPGDQGYEDEVRKRTQKWWGAGQSYDPEVT